MQIKLKDEGKIVWIEFEWRCDGDCELLTPEMYLCCWCHINNFSMLVACFPHFLNQFQNEIVMVTLTVNY